MSQNKFTISYPALHAGTDKSEIEFIKGKPDLAALFFEGEEAKETRRRFFVTDATVASLECMQTFISKFDDQANHIKTSKVFLILFVPLLTQTSHVKIFSSESAVVLSVISLPLPLQFINAELLFSLFLLPSSVW